MNISQILDQLENVRKSGCDWTARCPAHDDKNNSLSVSEGEDGRTLLKCFAGCTVKEICSAKGWKTSDLFVDSNGFLKSTSHGDGNARFHETAAFYYTPILRNVRFESDASNGAKPQKKYQWQHLDKGQWVPGAAGMDKPLYVNKTFREADQIDFAVGFEGESKADLAETLGIAGFSYKYLTEPECAKLAGLEVILWPDADQAGIRQVKAAAEKLSQSRHPRLIRICSPPLELPVGGDIVDAVKALKWGHMEIHALISRAIPYQPDAKPSNNSGGFKLTPLGELLARPDVPVNYVLKDRLVAGTVSIVVAKPKVGKSTFSRNLCLAVSRGEDFLGLKTKQGECIYLALEEREEDVRADFRAMGANGSEPILIHAATAPAEGVVALCDLVRERHPVFVVVDPLFRLAHIRDEKAYAETYAAMGPLIDIARIAGTHIQLTHHAGKSMKLDAIDSPLGSTAIGGAVATLLVMRRTDAYRTLQSVQRIGPDMPETVLEFDVDSRRVSLGGTRLEADRRECEETILAFLRDADGPQGQEKIRECVEGKTRIIRAALTTLAESGRIAKTGGGKKGNPFLYEFPNSGSPYIAGTREPELQNGPEPRINTSEILVPENQGSTILVPSKSEEEL